MASNSSLVRPDITGREPASPLTGPGGHGSGCGLAVAPALESLEDLLDLLLVGNVKGAVRGAAKRQELNGTGTGRVQREAKGAVEWCDRAPPPDRCPSTTAAARGRRGGVAAAVWSGAQGATAAEAAPSAGAWGAPSAGAWRAAAPGNRRRARIVIAI